MTTATTDIEQLKVRHLIGEQPDDQILAALAASYRKAEDLIRNSIAPGTRKKYRHLWSRATQMCTTYGLPNLPMAPTTVAFIVAEMLDCGRAVTYVRCLVGVIGMAHRYAGFLDPTSDALVEAAMKGASRLYGRPPLGKDPLLLVHLRRIGEDIREQPNRVAAVRDWAMLLLAFGAALRRSELVGIDWHHVRPSDDASHIVIHIPNAKTDRRRTGQRVVVYRTGSFHCPVLALQRWMRLLPEKTGPVFRRVSNHGKIFGGRMDPGSVSRLVKRYVKTLGLPPERYGGHSMRAGFITEGLGNDEIRDIDVMRQARQLDFRTTMGYYRPPTPPNLTKALGL